MVKKQAIRQDIIFDLKAQATDIERILKTVQEKIKNVGMTEISTQGYVKSIKGILEEIAVLRKTIENTDEVTTSSISSWIKTFSKLENEITKVVSKIESTSISFENLTGYDKAKFGELLSNLEKAKKAQQNLISEGSLKSKKELIAPEIKGGSATLTKDVIASIKNQKDVNEVFSVRRNLIEANISKQEEELLGLREQLNLYKEIEDLLSRLKTSGNKGSALRSKKSQAILAAANIDPTLPTKETIGVLESKVTGKTSEKASISSKVTKAENTITNFKKQLKDLEQYKTQVFNFINELTQKFEELAIPVTEAAEAFNSFKQEAVQKVETNMGEVGEDINHVAKATNTLAKTAEKAGDSLADAAKKQELFTNMQRYVTQVFGLINALHVLRRVLMQAWSAIKELDAAFVQIAVVTDFSTSQLWNTFSRYNKMAQQLGATTVGVIETSALYFQQGLETEEVMELTMETIKMARIANMNYAEATDRMTAALRGFKLEMSEAGRINDVFSALAAKSASDTDELSSALTRTASIAQSAGMELETTTAFLAQMIETTRESAENLGTAMKTIIARFQELKKAPSEIGEVEGEIVDPNKIASALRIVGVSLQDAQGQFRDLDDVFMELSSKWGSLDRNTQRYIATIAAGSRQQSRFLAMISDYKRTTELVRIAQDSAGQSSVQFAKTLDSVQARLNKIEANFQAIIGNLIQNEFVKGLLEFVNKLMKALAELSEKGLGGFILTLAIMAKTIKTVLTLLISQIADIAKKWQVVKTEMSAPITIDVHANTQPFVNEVSGAKTAASVSLPATKEEVVKAGGYIMPSSELKQKGLGLDPGVYASLAKNTGAAVAKGAALGLATGVLSGNWRLGLSMAVMQVFTTVLKSEAIKDNFSKIFAGMKKFALPNLTGAKGLGEIVTLLIKSPAGFAAIAAATGLVLYGLYKWLDPLEKADRKIKQLKDKLTELDESLEKSKAEFVEGRTILGSLQENIDEYKKLEKILHKNGEEQKRFNELANDLAEDFPQLLSNYDDQNNAILKQSSTWDDIIKKQKDIAFEQKQNYQRNLLQQGLLERELVLAEHKRLEAIINRGQFTPATRLSSTFNKEYKEALETVKDTERLQAELNLANNKVADSFKLAALAALEYEAALNNITFTAETKDFGSDFIVQQANEIREVLDAIRDPKNQHKVIGTIPEYQNASESTKELLGNLADINKMTTASSITATKYSEILSEIVDKVGAEITPSLEKFNQKWLQESIANIDETEIGAYSKKLATILIGDLAIFIPTILESKFGSNKEIAHIFGQLGGENAEEFIKGFENKNLDYRNIISQVQSELSKEKFAIGLNISKEQAFELYEFVQNFLDKHPFIATILGVQTYTHMEEVYGVDQAAKGEEFLEGLQLDPEQREGILTAIREATLTTSDAGTELYYVLKDLGLEGDIALQIIEGFTQAVETLDIVNKNSITNLTGLKRAYNDLSESTNKFAKLMNKKTFSPEELHQIAEEFPQLKHAIEEYFEAGIDGLEDLQQAFTDMAIVEEVKQLTTELTTYKDQLESGNLSQAETEITLNAVRKMFGKTADEIPNVTSALALLNSAIRGDIDSLNDLQNELDKNLILHITSSMDLTAIEGGFEAIGQLSAEVGKLLDKLGFKVEYVTKPAKGATILYYEDAGVRGRNEPVYSAYETVTRITGQSNTDWSKYFGSGGSKGGGGGKEDTYETTIDINFNITSDIERAEREFKQLERRLANALTAEEYDIALDELLKSLERRNALYRQYDSILELQQQQLAQKIMALGVPQAINIVNGLLVVNVEIIKTLGSETQKTIDELVKSWTELDKIRYDVLQNLQEIEDYYRKAENDRLRARVEVENRIIQILIKQDEEEIANLRKKYDKLKAEDDKYLDALRKNIDARRKARQREKDYNELAKKEKRLALLQRDTSGKYASEILSLLEEINEIRQELADKEVDDLLDNLDEEMKARANAYDEEIKAMEDAHEEKLKSMAEYNAEAERIMSMGHAGILNWLKENDEEFLKATSAAQELYLKTWTATIAEAKSRGAVLQSQQNIQDANTMPTGTQVTYWDPKGQQQTGYIREGITYDEKGSQVPVGSVVRDAQGVYWSKGASGGVKITETQAMAQTEAARIYTDLSSRWAKGVSDIKSKSAAEAEKWYNQYIIPHTEMSQADKNKFLQIVQLKKRYAGFRQGGLVDYTGLAEVHGHPLKPEAFLSAADTRNISILKDILNKVLNDKVGLGSSGTDTYNNSITDIIINMENQIYNEFDEEEMIEKFKQVIINILGNNRDVTTRTRRR